MDDVRLLDSHLHLWDPGHLHYAWLEGPLAARHDVAELTAALQDAPAVSERAFVFVQADCAPEQAVDEVDWVVERAGVADIRGVVAFAPVERPSDLDDVLARLCKRPLVRGIRRLLQGEDRGFALSPEFLAGAHAIARAGLTFDACVRHDQLADVVALADAVPELTIVLDHLGKPDLSSAAAARCRRPCCQPPPSCRRRRPPNLSGPWHTYGNAPRASRRPSRKARGVRNREYLTPLR